MASKIHQLESAHPDKKIVAHELYEIDGEILGGKKFVSSDMSVSERHITEWEKKGFKASPLSLPRLKLYNIKDLRKWHKDNVDQKQSKRRNSDIIDGTEEKDEHNKYAHLPIDEVPQVEAMRRKEIAALKKLLLQNDELEGRLVPADDLDRAMAEQAAMHISDKMNDEKTLPTLLENKSAEEISELLYEHNQEKVNMLKRIVQKEFVCDNTLYDIIFEILLKLEEDVNPDKIVEAIRGLS